MDTELGCLFDQSKTDFNYGDNKDLNKIKIDYGDNKDFNEVETNYGNDKDDIDIEINYSNNKDNIKVETNYSNYKKSIFLEAAACHIPSLLPLHLVDVQDLSNNITSIVKFDIIRLSSLADPMAVGFGFLTSTANQKYGSI